MSTETTTGLLMLKVLTPEGSVLEGDVFEVTIPGKYVKLADTIAGFKSILRGEHDQTPEQAFYMQGTIEDVVEVAKRMREEESAQTAAKESKEKK